MIRLVITPEGNQTLTEVCDNCNCHVNDLTTDDILVKGDTDMNVFNSKGEEITRTEAIRPPCKCKDCKS